MNQSLYLTTTDEQLVNDKRKDLETPVPTLTQANPTKIVKMGLD